MSTTVLLTLGRFPKALSLARALHRGGFRVVVADPFRWHLCQVSNCVSKSYRVTAPNTDRAKYIDDLLRIVDVEAVDLVIPVSEEVVSTVEISDHLPASTQLLSGDKAVVDALHDKQRFGARAVALGLPTPATWLSNDREAQAFTRSNAFITKPLNGCSGIGFKWHAAGETPVEVGPDTLLQQAIEGTTISTLSLIHRGKVIGTTVYEGLVYAGTVAIAFERKSAMTAVLEWVNAYCEHLDYTGFIAFDFIVDSQHTAWGIECNPRLTSGIHFFDPDSLANGIGALCHADTAIEASRGSHCQWGYSVLTEAYRHIFNPARFRAHLSALFRSRDVVWDFRDPLPFLLMTPLSWEILWPAITTDMSLGEASQRDIAALWSPQHPKSDNQDPS
ncbi:conserved domain protein [Luminiphilus syltensis NOR5-1B]|uniref:Conserved domain protein n=1 Tax=Luminiphilus syltensis NOR5-1B TaxID=565045 RepID=B8KT08_9GAMM|nr:ATP-grasp domain-containing protein [Luminiphilus syltensis]EED36110.1 conserved domain protein [Luminiphilus syltensis NOR5-1B]